MLLHEKAPGRAPPGRTLVRRGRRASGTRRGRSSEDERAALEEERAVRRRVRAWRGEGRCRRRQPDTQCGHGRPGGRCRGLHLRDGRARGRRLPGRAAAGRDGARPLVLAPLLLLTAAGRRRRARRQTRADARGGEEDGREGGDHTRRARPGHGAIVPGWIRAVKLRARSVRGSATPPSREAKRFVSYDKRQAALAKASVFATLLRKAVHRSDTRQSSRRCRGTAAGSGSR